MKKNYPIFILVGTLFLYACTGSKKYFKAAEQLEKKGLVNEAAEYYFESLQRKPTNVNARIKLVSVGQKYVSNLASDFFRNYNTQQLEPSLESFEKLKEFTAKTSALGVVLDYPKSYDDDYAKTVENYCSKNYNLAYSMVNQKKYNEALPYITNIKKYNQNYKTTVQLETISICEPLYQSAIISLENKNYANAIGPLSKIKERLENYKDAKELYELATDEQTKEFILIQPNSYDKSEKEIEDYLFNTFNQTTSQNFSSIKLINNTPFQENSNALNFLSGNANVDLIQAIRKATGADYFYSYDVSNKKQYTNGPTKSSFTAYNQINTIKNSTLTVTEYQPVSYNFVKGSNVYSYDYNYKIINAYSNQIVSSQNININSQDEMEFNEFSKTFTGDIRNLYPYNPQQTAPNAQYSPSNWRKLFSAKNTLKSFDVLKDEANKTAIDYFTNTLKNNIK